MKIKNWKLEIGGGRWRKPIAVIAIVALLVSLASIFAFRQPPSASAAWYNSDYNWQYRQKYTITNTGSALTDYQFLLNSANVSMSEIFSHSKEAGEDLRFTTSDQITNIPYWIENYSAAGESAKVWLKIPSVAATPTTTDFYVYYSNSGASAVSSFNDVFTDPSAVTGIKQHLKADSLSLNDGDKVATWTDLSGNGNSATQSTEANKPTYKTNIMNGKPALQFGGAAGQDYMSIPNFLTFGNNSTIFAVFQVSSFDTNDWVFCLWNNSQAMITTGFYGTAGAEQGKLWSYYMYDNSRGLYVSMKSTNKAVAGTPAIMTSNVVAATPTINLYLNGNLESNSSAAYLAQDQQSLIGARNSSAQFLNGYIAEVAVYNTTLSNDNRGLVDRYLGAKYGRITSQSSLTVALGGSAEAGDQTAPSNPTSITAKNEVGGVTLSASNVYNYTAPYFDWPAVGEAGGASDTESGVAGYYSYFGSSCGAGGADPTSTRGLLSEVGGTGVHYSADTDVTVSTAITTPGAYCLRMKTKDNFDNVQGTVWEAFVYQFENVAPNAPSYIAASPSGYTATNSFSFSWPIATDSTSSPQAGIAGYQYKRLGDAWSGTQVGTTVSGILKYQDGVNIFLVRAIDIAGNASDEVQTNYYYTTSAPTKPGSLAASPESSATNSFSFSWTEPSGLIANYGYSVNAWPTAQNITWTGSADVSLAAGPYATQQGTNIFYLVAKDEAGNYAFDATNVAQISFSCDSAAPPVPISVAITDSSNRTADIWSLTLKWAAGAGQNQTSFDHYSIYRSTDNATFSEIATTSSTSYVDTSSLSSDTTYYYYIKAVDNADQASTASTVVSRKPTGKYLSPPTFVSPEPTVTTRAGEATIKWVTDRNSSSMVRFGTDQNTLNNSQGQLDSVTAHSVTIKGLKSTTTYYYQVQSLDEMRDYSSDLGYSATFSFITTGLPTIANVAVSNITLTTADISWETSSATNHAISYGTSINYDKTSTGDSGSYVTNHSTKLENLAHSSTYHFKISGSDQDGNAVDADDHVFETQKMPEISFISYAQGNDGPTPIITVEWKTNVPTTSSIEYFPKDGLVKDASEQSESAMITEHKLILQGLSDSTEYTFSVSGRDQFGNLVQSSQNVLKTNDDKRPPKIDGVIYETSNVATGSQDESKIFVYWKTDELSTSQVEYAEGVFGNQFTKNTKEDTRLTDSHLVIVSGLKHQSPHFMRVCSKDKVGNRACSETSTVIPGEAKKSVFQKLLDTIIRNFAWVQKLVEI